jgi:hypothetical protein
MSQTAFFTCVLSAPQARRAALLIDSVRSFGGPLSSCRFTVLESGLDATSSGELERMGAETVPLEASASVGQYLFGLKVTACARAEELAGCDTETLVWLIPECLVTRPPMLFELGSEADVAVRPVHIRNVGSRTDEPPDSFWSVIYEAVGEPPVSFTVRSFVEDVSIRPYFNSAAFSFDPSLGLMSRWLELFSGLVADELFQRTACPDELHRVFLHQAVLSALIAASVERRRIRELPPDYGYPYNLQESVPLDRRAQSLSDTTCAIYEERMPVPDDVLDIEIEEPLRTWLAERRRWLERD